MKTLKEGICILLIMLVLSPYARAEEEPVTITYVTIGGAGMEPADAYNEMIAEFERENPGIKVKVENWPYRQSYQKYITLIAAGSPPDCGCGFMSMLAELRERGAIVPVDDYMPESLKRDFYDNLLEPLYDEEGRLWGMPYWFSVRMVYYRKDWFEELGLGPPVTPEQMLEAAQRIHAPPRRYAFGISGGVTRHVVQKFAVYLWTWGGEFLTEDGQSVAFNSEAGVRALEWWKEMSKYAQPGYLSAEGVDVSRNFRLGIIGMWRDTTQSGIIIEEENRPIEYDLIIAPVKDRKVTLGVMDVFYLFDTEHKEEAWKWMEFTQRNKYQAPITKELGFVPTRKSLAAEEVFRESPLFAKFTAGIPYAKFTPILPEWIQIQDILGMAIQRVLLGELSPREALNEAAKEANAVLAGE